MPSSTPSTPDTAPPRLSRSLSFHFLWTSTFASGFADRLAMLSVMVMLGQGVVTGPLSDVRLADASIAAAVNFWFFLPYVVWGPFAGWLADRLPRKWLMFASDELRGLIILGALVLLPAGGAGAIPGLYDTWFTLGPLELTHSWKVWLIMFSIGLFAATFSPAKNSVIPNVVGYKLLQRANSVVLGMGVIGNLFGFLVGGELAEQVLRACILASALAYLIPGWMWPFLKTPVRRHDRPGLATQSGPLAALRQIHQGGRYLFRHESVLMLAIINVLFWTGSHVIMAAGSAIAVDLYGGAIGDFAAIGGGFGLGMLFGAVALSIVNSRVGGEIILVVSMLAVAVLLSLLAIVPIKLLGIAIAVCMGFFGGMLLITVNTMIQQLTADGFRGRVMAFKELASETTGVTISLVIWQMADADRHILTLAHIFSLVLVIAAVWGLRRYVLRGPLDGPIRNLAWRLVRLYSQALHRLEVRGLRHVPAAGGALLVVNHTSGADPLLVQAALQRRVRWIMATDMMIRPMQWFWRLAEIIPVDRQSGRGTRQTLRDAGAALEAGQVVGIFPEGGINRTLDEALNPFEPGVGLLAQRADVPIIPVYIEGTPRANSAYGSLGKFSHSKVTFGEPVTRGQLREEADDADRNAAIARALRQRIESLRPNRE